MSLGLLHLLSSPFLSSLFFELKHSLQFVSGLSVCPEIFSWWDYAECFMWLIEFTFLRFPSGSLSRSLLLYWSHSNPALSSLICSVIFLYFLGINWFFWPFFWIPHFALHLLQWLREFVARELWMLWSAMLPFKIFPLFLCWDWCFCGGSYLLCLMWEPFWGPVFSWQSFLKQWLSFQKDLCCIATLWLSCLLFYFDSVYFQELEGPGFCVNLPQV